MRSNRCRPWSSSTAIPRRRPRFSPRRSSKGTFQEVIPLTAGGALDLTIGQYLTAAGTSIAGEGVKPAIRAEDDLRTERVDEALDQALRTLGAGL